MRVISSVGLERCFDRAEVTGSNPVLPTKIRSVAQPGSVLAWGASGRWFKSSHSDKKGNQVLPFFVFQRLYSHMFKKVES